MHRLIDGEIIGDHFPYDTREEKEIVAHMNRLFHRINRIPGIVCEAEWDHFGSGYASFVEFFCYRKEDYVLLDEENGMREIGVRGILLDISRLTSVAIMGEEERHRTICLETNKEVKSSQGSILDSPHSLLVSPEFATLATELQKALQEFNYQLVESNEMSEPLSFQTKIPTIYRNERQYLVMDAIFYWED